MTTTDLLAKTLFESGLAGSMGEAQRMAADMNTTAEQVNKSMEDVGNNFMISNFKMKQETPEQVAQVAKETIDSQIRKQSSTSPINDKIKELRDRAINPQPVSVQVDFDTPGRDQTITQPMQQSQEVPMQQSEPLVNEMVQEPQQQQQVVEPTVHSEPVIQEQPLAEPIQSEPVLEQAPLPTEPVIEETPVQQEPILEQEAPIPSEPLQTSQPTEQPQFASADDYAASQFQGASVSDLVSEPTIDEPPAPEDFLTIKEEPAVQQPELSNEPIASEPLPQAPVQQEQPVQQEPAPVTAQKELSEEDKKLQDEVDLTRIFKFGK